MAHRWYLKVIRIPGLQHLPRVYEALHSIPSTANSNKTKQNPPKWVSLLPMAEHTYNPAANAGNREYKDILGYIENLRPAWVTWHFIHQKKLMNINGSTLAACYNQCFQTPTQANQITTSGGGTQALLVFKIHHVGGWRDAQWLGALTALERTLANACSDFNRLLHLHSLYKIYIYIFWHIYIQ